MAFYSRLRCRWHDYPVPPIAPVRDTGSDGPRPNPVITFERHPGCDRGLLVMVDGQQVGEASYDDHGWSGIDNIEVTARRIAEAFGSTVTDNR